MRVFLWIFLAAPLIELWFMIRVGSEIGAISTIILLVLAGIVGTNLLRQQSLNTLLRVDQRLQMGEVPAAEILQGFVLALAAILLIIPGFITDILAIPLLISPLRNWLVKRFLGTGYYRQHYHQQNPFHHQQPNGQDADIIDGEFRREDDAKLP